ncbi:MAG TPA: phage tail protein [Candidatus Bathyarchaeia archaeon]|nr:phage tail protein [Candidatus Bathyarchaeia archaeon]
MSEISPNNFVFLNRDGRWPGFKYSGLEIRKDGALQLSSVPLVSGTLPAAIQSAPTPDGPAGLAIDVTGTLFFSDPDGNRVRRILGCDGSVCAAPCMGGAGSSTTTFSAPRGLLIPPSRPSLFVVDSGNNRIQVFDLETFQLVEIWGQSDASANQPGSQPGQFNTPWTLAADSAGNVYVVDYGNRRIQKFNAIGQVVPGFWQNVQASGLLTQPADIAVREESGVVWVLVVDTASPAVYIFDADGHPILNSQGQPLVIKDAHLTQPMGLAAAGDAVYVGDNAAQRVLRFQIGDDIEYIGAAIGYHGPVAALLLGRKGNLWVHAGGSLTPTQLAARSGYGTSGSLWIDLNKPLEVSNRPVVWHRLQALTTIVPANAPNSQNAHLDLYAYASSDLSQAPTVDPAAANPFSDPKWQAILPAANLDVAELFIGGPKAKYLWIGALFSGDGTVSPDVRQLRVEFDYPGYDEHLPAIYRNTANCKEFLARLLSLFESLFSEVEYKIGSLAALFDPRATPKSFLAWLAGCLGLDLDDNWDEQKQRQIIARIFKLSGRRGTPAGLRESLRLFVGVDATIEEPLLNASWWSLPSSDSCCQACAESAGAAGMTWQSTQNSVLGWTTMLAPAQPQGAVVGTSAVLDQSHLITDDEFGSPLFTDVAYQFSVLVYRSQVMCPEAIANIRAIVDQEKPAHTIYQLCVIDPLFRVGFQSRLGIDTVVAGLPRSLSLGMDQPLGVDSVLAGSAPSLLGDDSLLGVNTRLG